MPRQAPWIGIGTSGSWTETDEALYYGGLDYEVEQVDAYDDLGNKVPGILVNRSRTGAIMGVTSNQYGIVQNRDAFSLLDPFCKAGGVIEHAGMTASGMAFMVMRMPGMAFGFAGDGFELFVCAMNSFNGKYPLALIITPIRVICQNMFRQLMGRGDTALLIKHGRFANDRIISASKASSLLLDYQHDFVDALGEADKEVRADWEVKRFTEKLLPLTPETPEHPRAKFTNERVLEARREFIDEYYHAPDNYRYEGTRLGVLNAYYDWLTHREPTRRTSGYNEARFGRLLSGEAVDSKLILSA